MLQNYDGSVISYCIQLHAQQIFMMHENFKNIIEIIKIKLKNINNIVAITNNKFSI
jgi:hypothetical protein